jgi:hypothetical protein
MKVAVLGCGPAGLLAAHAAVITGNEVEVFSRTEKSHIHGAQYIHEPIVKLTVGVPSRISYAKIGGPEGYAEKVYLDRDHPTSWDHFPTGDHPAWPMGGLYALLWSHYSHLIRGCEIDSDGLRTFMESGVFDLVFCSVPRNLLCEHTVHGPDEIAHEFKSAGVVFEPDCKVGNLDNVVVYSGRESEDWYRTSRLFGHAWTEYGASLFVGENLPDDWLVGLKPTTTDCTCFNEYEDLVRIGRFGRWEKTILVTDAFNQAMRALNPTRHADREAGLR